MTDSTQYGHADATFQAAGGEPGLQKLAQDFYQIVNTDPKMAELKTMHDEGALAQSADKLYRFLCGWMGGPKRYRERYGPIDIMRAHDHLSISEATAGQWMSAMEQAIAKQGYPKDLRDYLCQQLRVPVDRLLARHQSRAQNTQ